MKRLTLALFLLAAGCTSTQFGSGDVTVKRTSFLTKTGIGKVTISKDGAVSMTAYTQQGDTEMMAAVVEAAVKAGAAAATGKP
jgi:hypothetical protein